MNDILAPLSQMLTEVILPNLKVVQIGQAEQIAANDRLENAIEELREHIEAQFAQLSAQLNACRAELAVTQALLQTQVGSGSRVSNRPNLIH